MTYDADAIVVGSGPSGVSVTLPMLEAGMRVLLLDGGKQRETPVPAGAYHDIRREDPDQWRLFLGRDLEALQPAGPPSPKFDAPGSRFAFEPGPAPERVEGRAFDLNLRPVSVPRLVETTVARLGLQFEEKGVALETDVPADLPLVQADEDRIGQVLLNLVGNALQYTPAGGQVRVAACHRQAEVQVSVADTGVGIEAEHLPLIFTRFYRVDKSRSRAGGGSGIGLTIAKHLVEAHGGRIRAESAGPDQGSTLTFTLPLAI